jgi:hypothetical protein
MGFKIDKLEYCKGFKDYYNHMGLKIKLNGHWKGFKDYQKVMKLRTFTWTWGKFQ